MTTTTLDDLAALIGSAHTELIDKLVALTADVEEKSADIDTAIADSQDILAEIRVILLGTLISIIILLVMIAGIVYYVRRKPADPKSSFSAARVIGGRGSRDGWRS